MTNNHSSIRSTKLGSGTRSVWQGTYFPLLVALLLRIASGPTASVGYMVLAVFALCGRVQAILALTFSWLFTMINPELVSEGSAEGIGRYAVMAGAAASAVFRGNLFAKHTPRQSFITATVLLGIFLCLHSILFSPIPDVSILKAVSWAVTMTSLLSLWYGLEPEEVEATANHIFGGLVWTMILSLPLLNSPSGYVRNGTGFQGVLNHPQVFGSTMALLGSWSGARMLAERRPEWRMIVLTGGSLVLVFLSEARTGGLAMILGLSFSLLLSPAFAGRSLLQMAPGIRHWRVWTLILGGLVGSLLTASAFSEVIAHFLSKSGRSGADNLFDAYDGSRGILIDPMLANIANDLFRGIGFGIASDPMAMVVERDPTFGLPIGASIEKGVAPLAILEEVGLFGAVLVALWLFGLLRKGALGGLMPFAVCLTALALNMGENTLFSPGGHGLLMMVLFGWIYVSGTQRARHA